MQILSKLLPVLVAVALFCAWHVGARAETPKRLGTFAAWSAATYIRNGRVLCYAFTLAHGAKTRRPPAMLTVLKRRGGRPDVILSPGVALPHNATLSVSTGARSLAFSAYGRDAFARDSHTAILALQRGATAVARLTGAPKGQPLLETFSLQGFTAAYAAVMKACA